MTNEIVLSSSNETISDSYSDSSGSMSLSSSYDSINEDENYEGLFDDIPNNTPKPQPKVVINKAISFSSQKNIDLLESSIIEMYSFMESCERVVLRIYNATSPVKMYTIQAQVEILYEQLQILIKMKEKVDKLMTRYIPSFEHTSKCYEVQSKIKNYIDIINTSDTYFSLLSKKSKH